MCDQLGLFASRVCALDNRASGIPTATVISGKGIRTSVLPLAGVEGLARCLRISVDDAVPLQLRGDLGNFTCGKATAMIGKRLLRLTVCHICRAFTTVSIALGLSPSQLERIGPLCYWNC